MTEYGIWTSAADYWVHFFPLERAAYVYRVDLMREYIKRNNSPIMFGASKDNSVTGAGYLVQQATYFVHTYSIPDRYLDHQKWQELTDREAGIIGETVVATLIEDQIIKFPFYRASRSRSRKEQLASIDFKVSYFKPFTIEAKTERKCGTGNLFIQARESGHKPNLLHGGATRSSDMPELDLK